MQVYVQAKSKKAINELLAQGQWIEAKEYIFGITNSMPLHTVPDGTVVKVFETLINGMPYAKAYGQMRKGKLK